MPNHYKFPYPSQVDHSLFAEENVSTTKYGLPQDVNFCRTCVISNQRPCSDIEFRTMEKSEGFQLNKMGNAMPC